MGALQAAKKELDYLAWACGGPEEKEEQGGLHSQVQAGLEKQVQLLNITNKPKDAIGPMVLGQGTETDVSVRTFPYRHCWQY